MIAISKVIADEQSLYAASVNEYWQHQILPDNE